MILFRACKARVHVSDTCSNGVIAIKLINIVTGRHFRNRILLGYIKVSIMRGLNMIVNLILFFRFVSAILARVNRRG